MSGVHLQAFGARVGVTTTELLNVDALSEEVRALETSVEV